MLAFAIYIWILGVGLTTGINCNYQTETLGGFILEIVSIVFFWPIVLGIMVGRHLKK